MKISKSDLPIDYRPIEERMKDYFKSPPCLHFLVNTWVLCNNVRGQIVRISKDGGTQLVVEWENGTKSVIRNPNYRSNI